MAINISNILTQLNTKMSSDSSATTTDLLRRVQVYNSLNDIGVLEFQSYGDLPAIDSNNIGQLAYVRASVDDSFGTFFFAKALLNDSGYYDALDSTNSGWQKIVLNANDSDNFADIVAAVAYSFQGSTSGYTSGGTTPVSQNIIEKFPFSTDTNSTDVGDLTLARWGASGQSSSTHGYTTAGFTPPYDNTIDKFAFASDGNATDVGDTTVVKYVAAGTNNGDYGYSAGGGVPTAVDPTGETNVIDKFPFASDANATDHGDLARGTTAFLGSNGASSTTHGYDFGGFGNTYPGDYYIYSKFPFAATTGSSTVGDLSSEISRYYYATGNSSTTHGYVSGGKQPIVPVTTNVIQKFPFSVDANTTDVGDLTAGTYSSAGQSSTANGYSSGGHNPPFSNTIEKFPFSTDANATDVGDLTLARRYNTGQQV